MVLLHGIGLSAHEIIDLSMDWAPILNKAEFVAPEIPWQGVANHVSSESDIPVMSKALLADLGASLQAYLDSIIEKRRLARSRIALIGFGEGALLAISVGMGGDAPLGAVLAIGRGLNQSPEPASQNWNNTPALWVTADVGPESPAFGWAEARRRLPGCNTEVDELTARGDYFGLDDPGIVKIAEYLRSRLVEIDPDSCD